MLYHGEFGWPGGAYIAVVFNVSWEAWPRTLATAENNQEHGTTVPADAEYGRAMMSVYKHAYAETGGMQRLLDLFERHKIRASIYVDGLAIELYPELAKRAYDFGHEFLVQGWDHSFLWEQTVAEQIESIDKTREACKALFGQQPVGYSSSAGTITPETFGIIADRGFKYACGFRNTDVPFIINLDGGRKLVGMTSYSHSDFHTYAHTQYTPRAVLEQWRDEFEVMYAEGKRGFPQMLPYGTHPLICRGSRTRPLEETIEWVKERAGVWITTRREIAEWVLREYPDRQLADFYPESAASSDRWYGLGTGAGGEEARREALRFRREH